MTDQKANFVREIINVSRDLLSQQKYIQQLVSRWNLNGFSGGISESDLGEMSEFAHLTPAELAGAITAITAIDTALGDYVSGQATNLLKTIG